MVIGGTINTSSFSSAMLSQADGRVGVDGLQQMKEHGPMDVSALMACS